MLCVGAKTGEHTARRSSAGALRYQRLDAIQQSVLKRPQELAVLIELRVPSPTRYGDNLTAQRIFQFAHAPQPFDSP